MSDMTRAEAIEYLNTLYMALAVFPNQNISLGNIEELKESVSIAINSLQIDEQYDLMYEQAEPKTGHWIAIDEEPHEDYECDKCGYIASTWCEYIKPSDEYKYCPNCGCRMVESQESEIHCNYTDAEIAKSFIEDVEAVKDLLPQESEDKG